MSTQLIRQARTRTSPPQNLPLPADAEPEVVLVDTTWGKVQPMHPFPGVPTVGELELISLVAGGATLIDTRVAGSRSGHSLPGAVHIPHDEIGLRRAELDQQAVSVVFCNGPQCPQTPDAIGHLLNAGHPAESLAYYRGGMHDWMTLGFPVDQV